MSTTLTAARVALLRRAKMHGGRMSSIWLDPPTKRLVTKMMADQPDPPWIDRIWVGAASYTLVLEPAGRAALQDAEARDGE